MTASPSGAPCTKERFSWCLFDFANSAFNTIIITFMYSAFFASVLVGDSGQGDLLWSSSLTFVGVVVAVLSPLLGVYADRGNMRRVFLTVFSLITILCTALLAIPAVPEGAEQAGQETIWLALVLVTIANISFELAFVFYNSYLPGLVSKDKVGSLSGKGWAFGYLGGLGCLGLCLGLLETGFSVQICCLIVAAWFLLFALPMFLLVPVRGSSESTDGLGLSGGLREVVKILRSLREFPDLTRLFIARLLYNDALIAVIGLAGIYMVQTLEMAQTEVLIIGIWLNVAAGLGAYGFGFLDDKIGSKQAIALSLLLLIGGLVIAIVMPTVTWFWIASTLVGIGMGPNQSASRSLLARFIAPSRASEYFGLFALSGKATVWLGPLLFSLVIGAGGSQRMAFLPLIVLFILGLILLLGIDEKRGCAAAARSG